ncbi:MAG: hypothetical protein ACM30H_07480 [Clostridia bacterium]
MRILVTGASGSGTTTLGRALADESDAAFFDVDDYYWLPTEVPYQEERDPKERLSLLVGDLAQVPRAVVSGSIVNWGHELEDSFSLIVFLTMPRVLRLARLREREVARFGRADEQFMEAAAQYDEGSLDLNSRLGDERWLAARSCPILRIDGDVSVVERVVRAKLALGPPGAARQC